jgi:single-strand DNA-binding protein
MFNRAILIGRITAEPELKQTANGISVCSFSLAVDRRFASKGTERQTDFINIVAWRQQAEFVSRYFHKGSAMGVEGTIQTRNYESKQGEKRTAVEVVADQIFFVGSKADTNAGYAAANARDFGAPPPAASPMSAAPAPAAYASGSASDFEEVESDDDLPF